MTELANFPFIDQRKDGDINHDFDCVPASLTAAANFLLGKNAVNDAAMKDEVIGSNYVGGTAASSFIGYLKKHGLRLYSLQGDYPTLLKQAHAHLARQHPVIFTRDDPYAPPGHPDWTHVCVWYKDTATTLTAMDPFGAQQIVMTDQDWISHLRVQELWILERDMLNISDVASHFEEVSASAWRCKQTHCLLIGGMLGFFRRMHSPLAVIGLPRTNEISVSGHTGVKIQVFERIVLIYDPDHVIDQPHEADDVYAMHIDNKESLGVVELRKVIGL